MGLFDTLGLYQNAGLLGAIPSGDFYSGPDEAQAARDAAALRMQRAVRREPIAPGPMQGGGDIYSPFGFQTGGMGDLASILNQAPAMPPIAPQQQPTALPQDAFNPTVPLPRPRPDIELPQNAQPATGPMQQPAMPSVPNYAGPPQPQIPDRTGFGDRLLAGFQGFAAGRGLLPAIAGGIEGFNNGSSNATVRALVQRGLDIDTAKAAATNPEIMKAVIGQFFGERKPAGTFKFGNVEIPYTLKPDGTAQVILPGGQTGTIQDFIRFGQKTEAEGKGLNAQAEKAGQVQGETAATAQIDLPGAVAQAKEQLRLLDELRNHPGRKAFGWHDYLGQAPLIPSTQAFDAQKLLDQIKGGAFLEAFKSLKGGGQITEVEGRKATDAIARMDRATSKAEFDKALTDYEGIIKLGIDRANQKAGEPAPYGFKGNTEWRTAPNGVRIRQVQ